MLEFCLQIARAESRQNLSLISPVHNEATETCNTAMEREFCRLFIDIFKNCENLSYESQLAFFWKMAEFANKQITRHW